LVLVTSRPDMVWNIRVILNIDDRPLVLSNFVRFFLLALTGLVRIFFVELALFTKQGIYDHRQEQRQGIHRAAGNGVLGSQLFCS
jgi:hypothetical protein